MLFFLSWHAIDDTLTELGLTLNDVLQNPRVARDIVKLHSIDPDDLSIIVEFWTEVSEKHLEVSHMSRDTHKKRPPNPALPHTCTPPQREL